MSSAVLEQLLNMLNGGSNRAAASANAAFKFNNIDPRVQSHLSRVYVLLAACACIAALGTAAHIAWGIHGFLTQAAAMACLFGLNLMRDTPANKGKRIACLGAFAFLQGAALGPLVDLALALQPSAVLMGFASTAAVFVSFSLSALLTQRRAYMFLGGWLASATTAMLVLRLGSLFTGSSLFFNVELYGGLLMFACYVIYDTQLIVERASAGEMDEVRHALDLLVDFISMFVRILIILIRNAEKEEEERRRKDRCKRN